MRLIDADALYTTMKQEWWDDNGIVDVLCVIDAMPTIDAVPVVHGEWIAEPMTLEKFYNDPYLSATCSICGGKSRERGNYCPNCGAKMDGKDGNG